MDIIHQKPQGERLLPFGFLNTDYNLDTIAEAVHRSDLLRRLPIFAGRLPGELFEHAIEISQRIEAALKCHA